MLASRSTCPRSHKSLRSLRIVYGRILSESAISFEVAGPSRSSLRIFSLLVIAHVVILNVTVVAPLGTVTIIGTLTLGTVSVILNAMPPLGAGLVSVIVQVPLPPVAGMLGEHLRLRIPGRAWLDFRTAEARGTLVGVEHDSKRSARMRRKRIILVPFGPPTAACASTAATSPRSYRIIIAGDDPKSWQTEPKI